MFIPIKGTTANAAAFSIPMDYCYLARCLIAQNDDAANHDGFDTRQNTENSRSNASERVMTRETVPNSANREEDEDMA
jgi:hypothetical protein